MPGRERNAFSVVLTLFALLPMIGCESAVTGMGGEGPDEAIIASHAGSDNEHALRGTGLGVLAGQQFAPDFGPPEFGRSLFGGRCSVPSDLLIRFTLSGDATRLGSYTAELEHCVQLDFLTGLNTMTDGIAVFTAANGDQLQDRYQRLVPGSSAVNPEDHRFTGGTGRFKGATGEAEMIARCDQSAGTCDVEFEGTLTYEASNRGG